MRIDSDFSDFYDAWADGTGPVLSRQSRSGPPKREQFRLLEEAGWLTPPHGTVGGVLESWWEAEKQRVKYVVVYLDEAAHCGEGKVIWNKGRVTSNPHMGMPGGDRYWKEKLLYCSAFVGTSLDKAVSLRYLQVGPHVFWIEYESKDSWMSNVGDGSCQLVGVELNKGYHPKIRLPLFAVDFVLGREMYAVDFNVAPGMRNSGVEAVLSPKTCCEVLEQAIKDLA